jgi:hypothetical protein
MLWIKPRAAKKLCRRKNTKLEPSGPVREGRRSVSERNGQDLDSAFLERSCE